MKKIRIVLCFIIIMTTINVNGSSGAIKQNSIIECNNTYYGNHGNPLHWHIVEKKNGKWVSISGEVSIPSCYIKKTNTMEKVLFSKCGDGDTARFIINGEEKKVRFLAIDTPELDNEDEKVQLLAKQASEYTCDALKKAKEIYLEYDGNSDKEDKYGRVLAFVHLDGVLLEKNLVYEGLARIYYIYGDYAHVEELREIEEIAKSEKKGIWNEEVYFPSLIDTKQNKSSINTFINLIIEFIKKLFTLLLK